MSRESRSSGSGRGPDPEFVRALEEGGRKRRRGGGHKDQQLCRQVQRALSLALEGELGEVTIVDVRPLAGCARLLVRVLIPAESTPTVLARLRERCGALRAEVARSISRKRAPELTFVAAFDPPHGPNDGDDGHDTE